MSATAPIAGPTYFSWVDPDPKTPPIAKLRAALDAYRAKYGQTPPEVRVYSYDQAGYGFDPLRVDGERIAVIADVHVPRHSIYIETPAKEESYAMPTATADYTIDQPIRIIHSASTDDGVLPPQHDVSPDSASDTVSPDFSPLRATSHATNTTVLRPPPDGLFAGYDFREDPHLQQLADELCDRHDLPAKDAVSVLWKRKGGKTKGKDALGKCTPTNSGLLGHFSPKPFTIWLAADNIREHRLTPTQIEACLFHELCHIAWGEEDEETGEMQPVGVWEDVQEFHKVLEVYGIWNDGLSTAKAHFEQATLL